MQQDEQLLIEIDKETFTIRVYGSLAEHACILCSKYGTCTHDKFDCLIPCG